MPLVPLYPDSPGFLESLYSDQAVGTNPPENRKTLWCKLYYASSWHESHVKVSKTNHDTCISHYILTLYSTDTRFNASTTDSF